MSNNSRDSGKSREKLTATRFYSEASESGNVIGLRCENGHVTVPPKRACRVCGSPNLIETRLSGVGRLIAFTTVYAKSAEFPIEIPYTLGLVRLEEGGNLLGIIDIKSENRTPVLNSKVRIRFKKIPESSDRPRVFLDLEQ
jgi:uncharacterized OB-fold protein